MGEGRSGRERPGPAPRAGRAPAVRLAVLAAWTLAAPPAAAHDGPPFPLVVDRPVGAWIVSVWADPDIGPSTFIVVLEPAPGAVPAVGTRVRVAVRPESGETTEVHVAVPETVRYGERHVARFELDRGGEWNVRILVDGPGGGAIHARVEATPDGRLGPLAIALYAIPFLAMAWIWVAAARRRPPPEAP